MQTVCFYLTHSANIEETWNELEAMGIQLLYSSEQPNGEKEIYAQVASLDNLPTLKSISRIVPADLGAIDWVSQWSIHGHDFHDGFVHLDVQGTILRLIPGPGFGNLSHPTTKLVLQLMENKVKGKHVLDIGTGSGILAIAAVALGAKSVCGIDIDPAAIDHARENGALNGMNEKIIFETNLTEFKHSSCIVLMNMIWSEQIEAWNSIPFMHHITGESLVSGILKDERETYLELCHSWGWTLKDEIELDGWLGFNFER